MQKDFHFYAVYVIAKAAGFTNDDAYDLAYASQFTDDNDDQGVIEFVDGGKFYATRTQHVGLNYMKKEVQNNVYLPFHFVPGNSGTKKEEKLVTTPANPLAEAIVDSAIEAMNKGAKNGIQRLGIAVHSYADTWSHQNFSCTISRLNEAGEVKGIKDAKDLLDEVMKIFFSSVAAKILPSIGHAQLGEFVDEPYRNKWSYAGSKGRVPCDNTGRFMEAARKIHEKLMLVSESKRPGKAVDWKGLEYHLEHCMLREGSLDARLDNWKDALAGSEFPRVDVKKLEYDDWAWFNDALELWGFVKDPLSPAGHKEDEQYRPKDGFSTSKWRRFQDAAKEQLLFVASKINPQGAGPA